MPAKVLLKPRAIVTAGLAKLVDDVNQYAPVMYIATSAGTVSGRDLMPPKMTNNKPKVAIPSDHHCAVHCARGL